MHNILDLEVQILEKKWIKMVDKNFEINKKIDSIKFYNPLVDEWFKIYGFGWFTKDRAFYRLPKDSFELVEKVNPKLNRLAVDTAGGQVHFVTNSTKLVIKVKLFRPNYLSGMTFVAQGGFDCYVGSTYDNLLFYNTSRFEVNLTEYEVEIFSNMDHNEKLIVLNFPLYNGVVELEIGLDSESYLKTPPKLKHQEKLVVYGTSIVQGGCVSRPGLAYPNFLSRALNIETINLGFSGNAFGEVEIAEIMASLNDVKMFILDYEANAGTNGKLEAGLESFLQTLRKYHPQVLIVVVSRIKYLFDDLNPTLGKRRKEIFDFQKSLVARLIENGDDNLLFIDGSKLLGDNYHEFTVDSVHPNDIGMLKLGEGILEKIRPFFLQA